MATKFPKSINPNSILTQIHHPQILTHFFISGHHHNPSLAGPAAGTLALHSPSAAFSFFSLLPNPTSSISNSILSVLVGPNNDDVISISFFNLSSSMAVPPNHFTFPLLFRSVRRHHSGTSLHARAAKHGFSSDIFTVNCLISMYFRFGDVDSAVKLFSFGGDCVDLVTWNTVVDGLVKNGRVGLAREVFDEMPERDLVSWNCMIKGHMMVGEVGLAEELFNEMPERDLVTWNSMVDGYGKRGEVGRARKLFDKMPERSIVSWNVMLAGYARGKEYMECLKLFDKMVAVGEVKANAATFVSVLTACAGVGDLTRGKWVHSLVKMSVKDPDILLSTTLLTMYSKCGAMELAREVFDRMPTRNVVSWNSMIIGYGLHGHAKKALELFTEMERTGPRPNPATFVCLLSACAHEGLVTAAWQCFDKMIRIYNIKPKPDHFGCMVDILGRVGLLEDCEKLANEMKGQKSNKSLWGAILSASTKYGNSRLGEDVARKMIETNPEDVGVYVSLSNIYASEGRWGDVENVREKMKENGVKKKLGFSLKMH